MVFSTDHVTHVVSRTQDVESQMTPSVLNLTYYDTNFFTIIESIIIRIYIRVDLSDPDSRSGNKISYTWNFKFDDLVCCWGPLSPVDLILERKKKTFVSS